MFLLPGFRHHGCLSPVPINRKTGTRVPTLIGVCLWSTPLQTHIDNHKTSTHMTHMKHVVAIVTASLQYIFFSWWFTWNTWKYESEKLFSERLELPNRYSSQVKPLYPWSELLKSSTNQHRRKNQHVKKSNNKVAA